MNNLNHHYRRFSQMSELFNAAFLSFGLIFVGWALGALLLKIQGAEE
jgi:cytochrome b6-f complex subunit 7